MGYKWSILPHISNCFHILYENMELLVFPLCLSTCLFTKFLLGLISNSVNLLYLFHVGFMPKGTTCFIIALHSVSILNANQTSSWKNRKQAGWLVILTLILPIQSAGPWAKSTLIAKEMEAGDNKVSCQSLCSNTVVQHAATEQYVRLLLLKM